MENIEQTLYQAARDVFNHEEMSDIMADSEFMINSDQDYLIFTCTLQNGRVIEERVSTIGISYPLAYALCALKIAVKAYEYYQMSVSVDVDSCDDVDNDGYYDEYSDYELNELNDIEYDCSHCEYFHECCGDMDVVDIDYYSDEF